MTVNFEQLGSRVNEVMAHHQSLGLPAEMAPINCIRATAEEIGQAEHALGVRLPGQYKDFMLRYGGGSFVSLDLLPVVASEGHMNDLASINTRDESFMVPFVAIAPVGTGDWWGFQTLEGECHEQVGLYSFENDTVRTKYPNFLEFVAREGLLIEDS